MQGLAGTWGTGYKDDRKCAEVVGGHIQKDALTYCPSDSINKVKEVIDYWDVTETLCTVVVQLSEKDGQKEEFESNKCSIGHGPMHIEEEMNFFESKRRWPPHTTFTADPRPVSRILGWSSFSSYGICIIFVIHS